MKYPHWYKVTDSIPGPTCDFLQRSDEVLAQDSRGTIRVAFVQYNDEFEPQWKLAGRDFYDFDDVVLWMPMHFLPQNPK